MNNLKNRKKLQWNICSSTITSYRAFASYGTVIECLQVLISNRTFDKKRKAGKKKMRQKITRNLYFLPGSYKVTQTKYVGTYFRCLSLTAKSTIITPPTFIIISEYILTLGDSNITFFSYSASSNSEPYKLIIFSLESRDLVKI